MNRTVSSNVLVAGLISLTTVAVAAVVVLFGLGKGDQTLVAVILGFVGANVTALMSLYQSAQTRAEIKNGALEKPVQKAVEKAVVNVGLVDSATVNGSYKDE